MPNKSSMLILLQKAGKIIERGKLCGNSAYVTVGAQKNGRLTDKKEWRKKCTSFITNNST
jgi:hypothetical protein